MWRQANFSILKTMMASAGSARRGRIVVTLVLLIGMLSWTRCASLRSRISYRPYESLLQLVADLQSHLNDDVYRFGYPRDLTGENLFKASIVRLTNFRQLYPGEFDDVVEMALAQCHERLGNYREALSHYRVVHNAGDTPLAKAAGERLAIVEEFDTVVNNPLNRESLSHYLNDAQSRLQRLDSLVEGYRATNYESLARLEREEAQVEYATVLKESRLALPDGVEQALEAFTRLIDENGESKGVCAHRLRLADFYADLAAEYVALNDPERGEFDWAGVDGFLEQAIQIYYQVSRSEGYEEREEGRLKLQWALEFSRRLREKSK